KNRAGARSRRDPSEYLRMTTARLLAIALMLSTAGCGVLGLAAAKFGPPETVPAQYHLLLVPTLILVEDYDDPAPSISNSERIAKYIGEELHGEEVPQ